MEANTETVAVSVLRMHRKIAFAGSFTGVRIRTSTNPSACSVRHTTNMILGASRNAAVLRVDDYLRYFARSIPELGQTGLYKGATGRIAVIGGSLEYTGAPYFAAAASLRGGGEMAFVFCDEQAALPIKCYSPELIVYPGFGNLRGKDAGATLSRMHAVLLGPGLGRSDECAQLVKNVISASVHDDASWPLVLDADALYFIAQNPELRELMRTPMQSPTSPKIYITPNNIELRRLCEAVGVSSAMQLASWFKDGQVDDSKVRQADTEGTSPEVDGSEDNGRRQPSLPEEDNERGQLSLLGESDAGRVIVISKGAVDSIASIQSNGVAEVNIDAHGGQKRCGGQGDVLSGLLTLFAGWTNSYTRKNHGIEKTSADNLHTAAAIAACVTTRLCSERAFGEQGRAMMASDLLPHIGPAFDVIDAHRFRISD